MGQVTGWLSAATLAKGEQWELIPSLAPSWSSTRGQVTGCLSAAMLAKGQQWELIPSLVPVSVLDRLDLCMTPAGRSPSRRDWLRDRRHSRN